MKVVKTDGLIPTAPEQFALLESVGASLRDQECLTEDALLEHCADADGLLVLREPVTARVIAGLHNCKVITRFGIGLDTIDVEAAIAAGITVTNVPDANIQEVSCHAMAMALALSRRLVSLDRVIREGGWNVMSTGLAMQRPSNQRFGILGFGRIGRLVAERARAFGFQVVAHDPMVAQDDTCSMVGFDELIGTSDIVSLHLPLTPATSNIVDVRAIAAMKAGAILINVSRGGLVDEQALADALSTGRLGGAGLDTFVDEPLAPTSPLLAAPNLLLSPHAAHYSAQSFAELVGKAFQDVANVLGGKSPAYPVTSAS